MPLQIEALLSDPTIKFEIGGFSEERIIVRDHISRCLEAVDGWADQRDHGEELVNVPDEIFKSSVEDIRAFFKSLRKQRDPGEDGTSAEAPRYRKKICVVGPSSWGKTSLIKSLTTNIPTLEAPEKRTIGVDLFTWQFVKPAPTVEASRRVYDVSIWDFAGQDEYQSVHTLFYSKRTLYVVCVNLKAYADVLSTSAETQRDAAANAFVISHIYSRMRAICVHEPESEFAFVGTKLDLIGFDSNMTQRIEADLMQRLDMKEREAIRQLNAAIFELNREIDEFASKQQMSGEDLKHRTGLTSRLDELMALKTKRPHILSHQLNAMSSANLTGVHDVRLALEDVIETSDTSFIMPPDYLQLGAYIQNKSKTIENQSVKAQIDTLFVNVSALQDEIKAQTAFSSLESFDITAILHTLHSIGDILWFDDVGDCLSETVFLCPTLVIDFVRKVVNHQLGENENDTLHSVVRDEGRVAHALLRSLMLWCDVDDDQLMLQLKGLLLQFQLAYPDGSTGLKWNSDLIVPIYWKKKARTDDSQNVKADANQTASVSEFVGSMSSRPNFRRVYSRNWASRVTRRTSRATERTHRRPLRRNEQANTTPRSPSQVSVAAYLSCG